MKLLIKKCYADLHMSSESAGEKRLVCLKPVKVAQKC
jgi:hypothetical protein